MGRGSYFESYGIEEICDVKPFVLYDTGVDKPDDVPQEMWNSISYNYSHAYFIPSTGHCVWKNGSSRPLRITATNSSENICLGTMFSEMNETEQKQFLSNYDKFKHLFKGT